MKIISGIHKHPETMYIYNMSRSLTDKQELIEKAKIIFTNNLHEGYSIWKKTNYKYISPARTEYIFQWLWDTAFHAIVLSHFDTNWAKSEITNFLLAQREDGFLPHIIFWDEKKHLRHWAYIESLPAFRPRTTSLTQPPTFALAAEVIYKKDPDKKFLSEVLPKIANHCKWLLRERDIDHDYLISIISPNESMDESPAFQYVVGFLKEDAVRLHYYYRKADLLNQLNRFNNKRILEHDYFNVEELLFNCSFIENCRALSRLFKEIKNEEESNYFQDTANKSEQSLLKKCWNEEDQIFYSIFSKQEKQARVKTVASLIPLFLEGLKGEKLKALIKHLLNPQEFWTNYPVPSVAKSESYYHPGDTPAHKIKLLWRGPTWVNTNWLIVKGLRKHGFDDIADEIVAKMLEMIKKNGFREYYNPETGVGYRHHNFGWSTLIIDLL